MTELSARQTSAALLVTQLKPSAPTDISLSPAYCEAHVAPFGKKCLLGLAPSIQRRSTVFKKSTTVAVSGISGFDDPPRQYCGLHHSHADHRTSQAVKMFKPRRAKKARPFGHLHGPLNNVLAIAAIFSCLSSSRAARAFPALSTYPRYFRSGLQQQERAGAE